ncbi:hypothetical protein B0H19DRAFT_1240460 [Mycena capillaripes]|nr:hypothetical protein B0H19DRAFT_1240460 [Mycena capillaripes]
MGLSSLHTTAVFDKHVKALILGLGIPGTSLTFLVLCAYGFAAWHPSSKPHLNRVSFRLLVYALVAKLTLVHMINGQKMEEYYIFGTIILCNACNVTPYALRQLGDADGMLPMKRAGSKNRPESRATVAHRDSAFLDAAHVDWRNYGFLVIVGYVISYEPITRNYRPQSEDNMEGYQGSSTPSDSPISIYRNIILRIGTHTKWALAANIQQVIPTGLYPLVSLLMNFSSCVLDLYLAQNPILTELNWRLGLADLSIFSVRPLRDGSHPTEPGFPARTSDTVYVELQSVDRGLGDKESSKDFHGTRGDARASFFNDSHEAEDTAKPLSPPTKRILSVHSRMSSTATLAYQI